MSIADWRSWKVHPFCEVFPVMSDAEYQALKADIERNGLLEPIWLIADETGTYSRIIDGRHRYRACAELNKAPEPLPTDYSDEELPEIVVGLNMRRRHLNESQRAMVAARIKPMYHRANRAKQLELEPEKQPEKPAATEPPGDGKPQKNKHARDYAAERLKVSPRAVSNAETVLKKGIPELVRAVDQGMITVSAACRAAGLTKAEQKEVTGRVLAGEAKNLTAALRQQRIEKAVAQVEALPPVGGEYHTIVADPPWRYEHRLGDDSHRGRTPYPTMTEQQIRELKVPAADTCVLWLWCTNAYLADGTAARVAQAWGFEPKTILTWVKPKMGVGDWLRGQTEHVILATRGRPAIKDPIPSTLLQAPAGEHSTKPDAFYELVERHCAGRRVELFACQVRDGWEQWGAELVDSSESAQSEAVSPPAPPAAPMEFAAPSA